MALKWKESQIRCRQQVRQQLEATISAIAVSRRRTLVVGRSSTGGTWLSPPLLHSHTEHCSGALCTTLAPFPSSPRLLLSSCSLPPFLPCSSLVPRPSLPSRSRLRLPSPPTTARASSSDGQENTSIAPTTRATFFPAASRSERRVTGAKAARGRCWRDGEECRAKQEFPTP